MRKIATNPEKAYLKIDRENMNAFIGLVADFRAANFAGDIPASPILIKQDGGNFELEWFVSNDCKLTTTIFALGTENDSWKVSHRIMLKELKIGMEGLA